MGHATEQQYEKWEKYYFACCAAAVLCSVAHLGLGWSVLMWMRVAGWVAAAGCSVQVARALRRMEQDGSWALFRSVLCLGIAAFSFV